MKEETIKMKNPINFSTIRGKIKEASALRIAPYSYSHQSFKKALSRDLHFQDLFQDKLSSKQKPEALVICCSDSRVVPALITNSDPGRLFMVRNVGNMVPKAKSKEDFSVGSAVEYAVEVLKVKDIIVCGHSNCGACGAIFDSMDEQSQDFKDLVNKFDNFGESKVKHWLHITGEETLKSFEKIRDEMNDDYNNLSTSEKKDLLARVNVIEQAKELLNYPSVAHTPKKAKRETPHIHAWFYDIPSGEIEAFNGETFEKL